MSRAFLEPLTSKLLSDRERRLLDACQAVAERRRWNRPKLEAAQLAALQELVEAACEQLPFYREKYAAAGFRPRDLRTLEDLQRIPLLTKDELRKADLRRLAPRNDDAVRLLSSSGSTGMALRVFRNEESLWRFTGNNMALYYEWCQGRPLTDVLYCIDLATDSIDFALADLLRTTVPEQRLLPVAMPAPQLMATLDNLRPTFFSTYPSTIRSVAIELDRRGLSNERLELLHLTSEMCDQGTRQLLRRVFPRARIIETYTSTEAGLIAFECPLAGGWHLAEDGLIAEIVDETGQPTEELGQLVVTDLTNWATPIIRYSGLGDLCRWQRSPCPCGTELRSLAQLAGRVADLIVLANGETLSPYVVTNALEELVGVYQFQVVQQTVTSFEVLVVRRPDASVGDDRLRSAVKDCLCASLGSDVACRVQLVERISPRAGAHKVPLVVSHAPRAA
jgi:phenylacetate-CoA ligase